MTWRIRPTKTLSRCRATLSGSWGATSGCWSNRRKSICSRIKRNYPHLCRTSDDNKEMCWFCRDQELSQIEPLPPLPPEATQKKQTSRELVPTPIFSPISPNADRNLIKPLGDCDEEFRLSVSHETNSVLWDLSEFAKAGKLLKNPPMDVEFYDEYEMRKVYSLIYDVFRCKYWTNCRNTNRHHGEMLLA